MRLALLAALFAAPLSAQTVTGGVGVAGSGGTEMLVIGGTATAPVGDWTVGAHGAYAEEIVLERTWQDWQATGALLAGRSGRRGAGEWTALAGPSLTRALRQPNVSPTQPGTARLEPGVMARVRASVTPFRPVPIGLSFDLGLNVSTGGLTFTALPGLAVRLGR